MSGKNHGHSRSDRKPGGEWGNKGEFHGRDGTSAESEKMGRSLTSQEGRGHPRQKGKRI